jgi:hypothetical protein
VNALLKSAPVAALLGAWIAVADLPPEPLEATWTSNGFARALDSAAGEARADLLRAPEIARAGVTVTSPDDHAPLRVEATVAWTAPVPDHRKESLRSAVRARFDDFARVDVVLSEEPR